MKETWTNLQLQYQSLINLLADLLERLKNHEGFKRYFKNTGWMFAGQLSNMVVAFFVGAYIARYLGPNNYGIMNYAASFAGLFAFLAGFGIDGVLNRELVRYPDRKGSLIGNSFWIKLFGGIITIIAINASALVFKNDQLSRFLIFIASLAYLFQSFGVINAYFQSQVLSKKNVQAQLLTTAVSTLIKISFIFLHLGVIWFTAILVSDAFTSMVMLLWIYNKQQEKIYWRIDGKIIKGLLRDSWPLMFAIVAMSVYLKIDQTMLKFMMNASAVGVYAVAVKLSEVWYFIPNIICASLFPAIINAQKTDLGMYRNRLKQLYRSMLALAVVIALPSSILAGFIIKILFGPAYAGAVEPLQIYIWSGVPVFLMAVMTQFLIAENYTKLYFTATVLGAITNILLNLIFIPKWGITGSALATLISYCVPLITTWIYPKTKWQLGLLFNFSK